MAPFFLLRQEKFSKDSSLIRDGNWCRCWLQRSQKCWHQIQSGTTSTIDWSIFIVPFNMLRQMIGPHEPSLAIFTFELLFASVGTFVSGQFIGAWEPPTTVLPLAYERFLTGMCPIVGFQMWRFEIVFTAALVFALVNASSHWCRYRRLRRLR